MKLIGNSLLVLALTTMPLAAAQLYRWVDEKGRVEWRDTPPPPDAKNVEQRRLSPSTISSADVPFSVQQAMKNFPVTLWVTNCGESCDRARAHLARRGVPYSEKNPLADLETFKQASGGGMEVPLLIVGSNRYKGYLESDWDAALNSAGYPRTPYLGYKAPPPAPDPKPEPESKPAADTPAQPPPAQ
ncbi:MAG: glutaredoxin family protein [Betaproteobacteria bacterium]|nr:glutaredoxin family protein [Betaproteobacteria bacterium]